MTENDETQQYPGGPLPQREPMKTLADWDRSAVPVTYGPGERPWQSPGQPPWAVPVMVAPPVAPSSTVAVWALVTGVVGVLAGWCMLGLPCIAALVLGHIGVNQTKDGRRSGRGMAVTGLVLGYVALIPAVVLFFWVVVGGIAGGTGGAVLPTPLPS